MLFGSLAFYGLFATIVCAIVTSKKTVESFRKSLLINGVISFLYCWAIFSAAHYLSYFLFWLGGERLFRSDRSPYWIWLVAVLAGVLGHTIIGLTFGLWHVRETYQIEQSLPVFSIDDSPFVRSAYPTELLVHDSSDQSPTIPSYELQNLEKTLHQSVVERFIHAPSFGVGRMRIATRLPSSIQPHASSNVFPQHGESIIVNDLTNWTHLIRSHSSPISAVHDDIKIDFAKPGTLGFEWNPRQIIGFERHGAKLSLDTVAKRSE